MPKTSLFDYDMSELLGLPRRPVTKTCDSALAGLVCKILDWQPVTVASLVAEGMSENEARQQLGKATALVLKNYGGSVAIAARLAAITGEGDAAAAVGASRAFKELQFSAKRDSDRLDEVRTRFQQLAKGKS